MKWRKIIASGLIIGGLVCGSLAIPNSVCAKDCYTTFCNDEEWDRYNEPYYRQYRQYYDAMSQKQYENFHNDKYGDVYNPEPNVPPPRERW